MADSDVRLNRYIAQSGLCARRKADELIAAGKVLVNGKPAELGSRVSAGDVVLVEGREISPLQFEYVIANKPGDAITTREDERGRRTVFDALRLPDELTGVNPVGRLDRDTTGVLLLTNDGDLANRLLHPRYGIAKRYRVTTKEPIAEATLDRLSSGVELEDGPARVEHVTRMAEPEGRSIALEIRSGRNRIVRRMFEAVGHPDIRLERLEFAGLTSRGLRPGRWRRLTPREIGRLRRQAGLSGPSPKNRPPDPS